MLIESLQGNLDDARWQGSGAPAWIDELVLDQWQAQKNRLRATTRDGTDVALSLPRGTRLRDGDVLWSDPAGSSVIVARPLLGEVMVVDLPRPGPGSTDTGIQAAVRAAVELGHALGNQHWPAVVKEGQLFVPVTLDRTVMDSVMRTHRFTMISYRFVPGAEVIPYLAPHEARRLFGAVEQHTHHPVR
ncbi:urease accessory protein UreE [Dactylosporangium sp. NPDC000521]|uniref:urease accessory protein UreE n=1 Tax=Dactylosporangium sp. NPDC000521 TaxID=3363975 RepID=UPI0036CD7C5D